MDPRTVIANRIDLHLRRHLGQGVDADRALTDARYVRDVLLVCDAMAGTNLPLLARQFRQAGEHMARDTRHIGRDTGPPLNWAANTSGFGVSQPLPIDGDAARKSTKPWFLPSRWLAS